MKKFSIISLLLLIALPMFAEHVDPETAQKVAKTFLNNNGAKAAQLADLSKEAGFPNLYIFTSEEGFVVMSADDCVQPILGYSLNGIFTTDNMPSNVRGWLQGYNDEIQYAMDNNLQASKAAAQQWKDLAEGNTKAGKATVIISPLIQTKWNQNWRYNQLCPLATGGPDGHAYTGCVATAMAQVMKYWNYPPNGIGSYSYNWENQTLSANFGATTYDWDNMVPYYYYYVDDNGTVFWDVETTEVQNTAVATLMYHCGVSVNMNYGGGGSSAVTATTPNALENYFNYQPSSYLFKDDTTDWENMVKNELNNHRPLIYSGHDPDNASLGHAFVCDGYDNRDYFHFNWGWSGNYDGYFSLSNLDTGANGQSGQGNGVYTSQQAAVFGIQPASMIPAPANLTYTLGDSQQITLSWDAVSEASSYNVYRDGILLGNTAETTYSETAPFGTHEYYVRSMDANSLLSLLSNLVSISIDYPTPIVDDLTASFDNNTVNLSWTAPEWTYPETPSATLTYGNGQFVSSYGFGGSGYYWGHKYPASILNDYSNMVMYKAAFYASVTGTYKLFVYKGTTSDHPQTIVMEQTFTIPTQGWMEFDLSGNVQIEASQDYWVFIYDPEGKTYPASFCYNTDSNEGGYFSGNPTSSVANINGIAFLIKVYLTDGTYTYNLYDGDTKLNGDPVTETSYAVPSPTNNTAHRYTVKTNYYGGETKASNMVGFTLGTAELTDLELAANDKMTLMPNSKLTVSGDLSDEQASNLVLEEAAQLIHSSADVKATVNKHIDAYETDEDGWYFIASPVTEIITPTEANGLLANDYDLYLFNQSEVNEWRNIRAESFSTIDPKVGYLYGNNTEQTLAFTGTLAASTTPTNLAYDGNAALKGFNLVGNPYPCNTTIDKDFYVIEGNRVELANADRQIAPCEGVFVKATGANQTVTFTKVTGAKGQEAQPFLDLEVSQGNNLLDRARVRFGEGIGMEKYSLDNRHTQLSLSQGREAFAVAYTGNRTEMPLNFKAMENGEYTLTILNPLNSEFLGLNYLHLIDNLTGADIDLLAPADITPLSGEAGGAKGPGGAYTFSAKTTDYASRFKLVFNSNSEDGPSMDLGPEEPFAFISNGSLIVSGAGTLQVIDMLGRIIHDVRLPQNDQLSQYGNPTTTVNFQLPTTGVYVLRLVTDKETKTQKIILNQ